MSRAVQVSGLLAALSLVGCASPYRADQGALLGGLGGAGVGALVGAASDNPLAGAAIGGLVGTIGGSLIGGSLDEIEARNRAEIEARLGRPAPIGAVTLQDVVAMTQAGVSEEVISTHVRNHGITQPLTSNDIIYLQNQGVSSRVIQAMQTPVAPVAAVPGPAPVIIEEHYYDPWGPRWGRYPYRRGWHHRHYGPDVGFGFSFSR